MFERDEWLLNEFIKRKEENSAYSLRSYARDLSISPATLSNTLNGKSSLSFKSAKDILEKLNFETNSQMIILTKYKEYEEFIKVKKKRVVKLLSNSHEPIPEIKYVDFETAKKLNFWEANYLYSKLGTLPEGIIDIEEKKSWLYKQTPIPKDKIDFTLNLFENSRLINKNLERYFLGFNYHATAKEFSDLDFRRDFFKTHYEFQDLLKTVPVEDYPFSKWTLGNLSLEASMAFQSLIMDFYFNAGNLSLRKTDQKKSTYGFYVCSRSVKFGAIDG